MIQFFYFTNTVRMQRKDHESLFEGITNNELPVDKIYFSTPYDFFAHIEHLKQQIGDRAYEVIHPFPADHLMGLPDFPVDIGFGSLEEKLTPLKGKAEVKIAILNAISRGIGDYLMGMRAFEHWYERVCGFLEGTKVSISFFQFHPLRVVEITYSHFNKIKDLRRLPEKASLLMEHDAYIDFGDLLAKEGFDAEPMIDFFLKGFSIDPTTVADKDKRIKFEILPESVQNVQRIMKAIRSKGRPVLLFHRSSTTPIRQMSPVRARQMIAEIIKKTDYFVASVDGLDYQNDRFVDLSPHSTCLNDLAAIISQVDGLITVDTCLYHFADAFSTPSVVLFTSINPDLRTRYYPTVRSIMLEDPDGPVYGKHKESVLPEERQAQAEHVERLWDKLDVDTVLNKLKEITLH